MRATERAPAKFPDSAPRPVIHLQVSYGCFPLLWFPSPRLRLEIAFSRFPRSPLPVPFFIETLAEACREIRLWRRREREKHDIHSAGTHVSPLAAAPALNGVFRGPGVALLKHAERWRHGARQISESKWHRWWHLSWWWWICIWEGGGGILCPAVSVTRFERRTNTSPSITANDKTGWMERRRKLTRTDRRLASLGPCGFSQLSGMYSKQEVGARWWVCTPTYPHVHFAHTHTHARFKIQLWGIEELEWFNWFSKWPVFRDE